MEAMSEQSAIVEEPMESFQGEDFKDTCPVRHWGESGTHGFHALCVQALRTVFDPEIPINIYDLGLALEMKTWKDGKVKLRFTLTTPNCPEAEILPGKIEAALFAISDCSGVEMDLTWDEPWAPERLGEAVRLELGLI